LLNTAAVVCDRPDLATGLERCDEKTFWLTGHSGLPVARSGAKSLRDDFPEGGYHILRRLDARVIVDCGPLGYLSIAAHGHADALSLLLDYRGVPFLVDPGTFAYHTDRAWRDYFRGTTAHNTVVVDGQDQSVIGGSFMWLRHARATLLEHSADRIRGRHDGYTRLADPVVHEREVRLDAASGSIIVTDRLECRGAHTIDILWHLHPHCRSEARDGGVRVENAGAAIVIRPDPESGTISLHHGEGDPPMGWYSPGIDRKTPATAVRVSRMIEGTTVCRTRIQLL
jgi:hypothetical protein